jgi:hypothetical protein
MRKQAFIALESKTKVFQGNVLSLEEELVIRDSAYIAAEEVDSGLKQIYHLTDLIHCLEDLAEITGDITTPTITEANLINNATDMAVAGTDVSPDDIAKEAIAGESIATEGFVETAKAIWENIVKFLKTIWAKMGHFYRSVAKVFESAEARLNIIKEKSASLEGSKAENDIELTSGLVFLSVDGKTITNEDQLKRALNAYAFLVKFIYFMYMESTIKKGNAVIEALSKFAKGDIDGAIEHAWQGITNANEDNPILSRIAKDPDKEVDDGKGGPKFRTMRSVGLLGNKTLVRKIQKQSNDHKALVKLNLLSSVSGSELRLEDTEGIEFTPEHKVTMPALTPKGIAYIVNECETILKYIKDFDQGGLYNRVEETMKEMARASKEASVSHKATDKPADDTGKEEACYHELVKLNTAYAGWVRSPGIPLMQQSLSIVNTFIMVIQKSIECYPVEMTAPTAIPGTA